MSKHTKGPWRVQAVDGDRGAVTYEIASDEYDVTTVSKHLGIRRLGDAQLIAAAPEMLELLETALRFAGEYHSMTRQPRTEDYWIHRENLEPNFEATKELIAALLKRVKGVG